MNLKKLLSLQNTQCVRVYYIVSYFCSHMEDETRRDLVVRVLGIKEVHRYNIK
jgi:hypothetical protein